MTSTLHRAVQYLAAAGKSHATMEADDGHTTMSFEPGTGCMVGVELQKAKGIRFALSIPEYAFQCRSIEGAVIDRFPLFGAEHDEVVDWFRRMIKKEAPASAEYRYSFHYDLPVHSDRSPFPMPDVKGSELEVKFRTLASEASSRAMAPHEDTEEIRIWPHHFDTGSLITLSRLPSGTPISTIGLGLAIPDDMVSEHYLYVSPWHAEGTPGTTDLPELTMGRWSDREWKGAILEVSEIDMESAVRFFQEASEALLEPVRP